jgi:hypothetical protein
MNMTGDKTIGILDLTELCASFSKETLLGQELHYMLEQYTCRNVRVKYNAFKV